MKRIIVVFGLIIWCACRKEKPGSSFVGGRFAGTWELRQTATLFSLATYAPGNGNLVILGESGAFTTKRHDTVTFTGPYRLEVIKDCHGEDQTFFRSAHPLFNSGSSVAPVSTTIRLIDGKLFFSAVDCTPGVVRDGGTTYIYSKVE